jgi:hypothetical protein
MTEERHNKWNLEDLATHVIIGFISRLIGFILRTFVIVAGLIALTLVTVAGVAIYLFWIVAPIMIVSLLGLGATLLFA